MISAMIYNGHRIYRLCIKFDIWLVGKGLVDLVHDLVERGIPSIYTTLFHVSWGNFLTVIYFLKVQHFWLLFNHVYILNSDSVTYILKICHPAI